MTLRERQAQLVQALVAGGPLPDGFPADRVAAVREQLMRKRAGEVATAWPVLRGHLGDRWYAAFSAWASSRPPLGSLHDGLEFAHTLDLTGAALEEFRLRAPRPRSRWWKRTPRSIE
jgi:hypothetical protein